MKFLVGLGAAFIGPFAIWWHLATENHPDDAFRAGTYWGLIVCWVALILGVWLR